MKFNNIYKESFKSFKSFKPETKYISIDKSLITFNKKKENGNK